MRENNELDVEEEQNAQIAPDSQAMPLSATTPAVSPLDTSVNSLRLDLSGKVEFVKFQYIQICLDFKTTKTSSYDR
jgi:hypothetical protein